MPDRLSTNTKPTSDVIWIRAQRMLTRKGPIWSASRPMAKVAATAVGRISEIAAEPRAGERPRSPQNATMCTNGTAIAAQQQKPAAESSAISDRDGIGRRERSSGGRAALARATGEGRMYKAQRNIMTPA